jgi:hypothetical protein
MLRLLVLVGLASASLLNSGWTGPQQSGSGGPNKTVEVIKIDLRAILKLPPGRNYSMDLSRKGVIYEIDPSAGIVDLDRVVVHTATGDEPLESWLEKTFTREGIDKVELQSLRIGYTEDFRRESAMRGAPRGSPSLRSADPCGEILCSCDSSWRCVFLLASGKCGEKVICSKKNTACVCRRKEL